MRRGAFVVVILLATVAACGGSDDISSDEDAENLAVYESVLTVPEELQVTPIDVEACDLVTSADVEAASGFAVERTESPSATTCDFDLATDGILSIFVSVEDGSLSMIGPKRIFDDYVARVEAGETEAIAGLGSHAVFDAGYRALAVDAGDGRYVVVGVNGGFSDLAEPREQLIELARRAVSNL